jgi:hypothetical protein
MERGNVEREAGFEGKREKGEKPGGEVSRSE